MSSLFPFYGYFCLIIIKEDFFPLFFCLNVVNSEVICNGISMTQMENPSPATSACIFKDESVVIMQFQFH